MTNADYICINSLNPCRRFNLFKAIFRPLGGFIMNFIKQKDYIMYSFMINELCIKMAIIIKLIIWLMCHYHYNQPSHFIPQAFKNCNVCETEAILNHQKIQFSHTFHKLYNLVSVLSANGHFPDSPPDTCIIQKMTILSSRISHFRSEWWIV